VEDHSKNHPMTAAYTGNDTITDSLAISLTWDLHSVVIPGLWTSLSILRMSRFGALADEPELPIGRSAARTGRPSR
jgi:hypothetical protein